MLKRATQLLLIVLALVSCQEKSGYDSPIEGEIQSVSFTLNSYDYGDLLTKTDYDSGADIFNWSEGDAVGIMSPEGSQLRFPIRPEFYGQSSARFDGRGFALKSNTEYSSYYPFIPDFELDPSAVPVSYKGQSMLGDNNTAGLGKFAYTVAKGSAPSAGVLDFSFQNIGSPHRYRMPALPGEYEMLTLIIPESEYILNGTIDLRASDDLGLTVISPTEESNEINLSLSGTTFSSPGPLRCWMMMPPVNLDGEVIGLTLTLADGSEIVASVAGRDCPANSRRVFNALTSVYPAESTVGSDGGAVQVKLIRTAATDAVTMSVEDDWLNQSSSSTDGLVTTYTFTAAANSGAEREGSISFTETSTGLTNTVKVIQQKAGTVIGIGGWDTDSYSGKAN